MGRMVNLTPREGGEGMDETTASLGKGKWLGWNDGERGARAGPALRMSFFVSPSSPVQFLFRRIKMEENARPHFDGNMPRGFAEERRTGMGLWKYL